MITFNPLKSISLNNNHLNSRSIIFSFILSLVISTITFSASNYNPRMNNQKDLLFSSPSEWIICGPNSWEELKNYLPEAKMSGVTIKVVILPPFQSTNICTEGSYSEPFQNNYIRWAQEIAKLSLRYSNIVQYEIYQLRENLNLGYLRSSYVDSVIATGQSINPRLHLIILPPTSKTYYVSNSGNDNNNGLSPGTAWATLAKINRSTFSAGDSILFRAGDSWIGGNTFHGNWNSLIYIDDSGTSINPIFIGSYGSGEKPYFKSDTGQYKSGMVLAGSYIVLDGLDIDSCRYNATVAIGSNNTIQNCEIRHCGIGATLYSRDNLFTRNYVHSGVMTVNTVGGNGEDYGAIGVLIIEPKNEVSHCTFDSLYAPSYDFGYDGNFVEFFPNGVSASADSCYIHHNVVTQTNAMIESYAFSGSPSIKDVTYAYNLFYLDSRNVDVSAIFAIHTGYIVYSNVRFVNNTIYFNSNQENTADGMIAWTYGGSLAPGSLKFYNNIIVSDSVRIVSAWIGSGSIEGSNNIFYRYDGSTTLGLTLSTLGIRQDPTLTDIYGNNFIPLLGSPAIDRGIDMGFTYDIVGNPIVNNPDIGAYERH